MLGQLPQAVAQSARTELAGETVVVGSRTAMEVVNVDRPATFRTTLSRNPSLEIESDGMFAGLVLKEATRKDGIEIIALRIPMCTRRVCREHAITTVYAFDPATGRVFPKDLTLPRGEYYLYLVSDGSPMTARLHLGGLDGKTIVHPDGKAAASYGALEPTVSTGDNGHVFSAGVGHDLGAQGISLVGVRMALDQHKITDVDTCLSERRPVDVPLKAGSLCLDGSGWAVTIESEELDRMRAMVVNYEMAPGADYYHALGFRTVSMPQQTDAFHFRLAYPAGTRSYHMSGLSMTWSG